MSKNKLMLKDGVLSKGGGVRRVILCYDSGLCYQYSNPENVTAIFQPGMGWIVRERPRYYAGGWGNAGTGDADGHYLIINTQELIDSIGAARYSINQTKFLTNQELKEINAGIAKNNKLIQELNKIAKKLGRHENEDLAKFESMKTSQDTFSDSPKGVDAIAIAKQYDVALKTFLDGKGRPSKIDAYSISKNLVVQSDKNQKTTVAFRDGSGQVFMNSQVLKISKFEESFMGGQSLIQKSIRGIAKYSIPFNVLESADLKFSETKVLEQGPESTHTAKVNNWESKTVERHFTGALLLENAGRKFLMDIDRVEIEHQIFNAFFVEVSSSVKSIAEAYESMKPQVVRDAEAKGIEVKRQGEWFFIATDKTVTLEDNHIQTWKNSDLEKQVHGFDVAHGKGRPNRLFKPVGFGDLDQLVCGTVTHSGREHAPLDLGQQSSGKDGELITLKLWELVGNTTVSNFTITGDVD